MLLIVLPAPLRSTHRFESRKIAEIHPLTEGMLGVHHGNPAPLESNFGSITRITGVGHTEPCFFRSIISFLLGESCSEEIYRDLKWIFIGSVAVRCFCPEECFFPLDTQARLSDFD